MTSLRDVIYLRSGGGLDLRRHCRDNVPFEDGATAANFRTAISENDRQFDWLAYHVMGELDKIYKPFLNYP